MGKFCFKSVILQKTSVFPQLYLFIFLLDGIIIDTFDVFSLSNLAFVAQRKPLSGSECISF